MTKIKTALIIGASRGLGLALAEEFLKRGWQVVGTVRGNRKTNLHDLANEFPDKLAVESVDITDVAQIAALKNRLTGKAFDFAVC